VGLDRQFGSIKKIFTFAWSIRKRKNSEKEIPQTWKDEKNSFLTRKFQFFAEKKFDKKFFFGAQNCLIFKERPEFVRLSRFSDFSFSVFFFDFLYFLSQNQSWNYQKNLDSWKISSWFCMDSNSKLCYFLSICYQTSLSHCIFHFRMLFSLLVQNKKNSPKKCLPVVLSPKKKSIVPDSFQ